ncbi:hypothetical protein OIU84_009356 [Salix udensis]|uniref:Uncharacterized protein n=1 Tax=Salix udensis TaxID=889485 RepID=A0AAD6JRH2_9ROSI|nr:hypothetical protein OIU84_009356 [Salix udensis]
MPIISVMKCHNPANMVHVNDCEFWSGDPDPDPRQVVFIPDLPGEARATGCSYVLSRVRIDELKEQKAINIVGESNIERKLWWDLESCGGISVVAVGSWPVARCTNLLMKPCA